MQNAILLSAIIGPVFLVYGLSMLLYVKQWQKIMQEWQKNHFLWLPFGVMSLILGLIVVNMYNVWEWSFNVVITITGWYMLIKSIFYFLAPEKWIKKIMGCKCCTSFFCLYLCGIVMTILGILLSYDIYLT